MALERGAGAAKEKTQMEASKDHACPGSTGEAKGSVRGQGRPCEGKRRKGRRRRKLVKVRVVKRVWWRGGSGTKLLSETVATEIRDSRGRIVGGEKQRMTPRSKMGGRSVFRACEMASLRAGAGVDFATKGGVA